MRIAIKSLTLGTVLGFATVLAAASPASADTMCDLRIANANQEASCSITGLNTGYFYTDEQHPTGTGFIDSFLRIQQNSWEQGYNTSTRPLEEDNHAKTDPNFTRDLELTEVGTKDLFGTGTLYREFFLDINEPAATGGNKNYITLDQLEIYVSNKAGLSFYCATGENNATGALTDSANCTNNDSVKIYDMDTATSDNYVQLDYLVKGNGSGSSDMTFYLKSSLFGNYKYVYLFSQFGDIDGNVWNRYESQAGFEEWFVKDKVPPPSINSVPEPASLMLLGTGLAAAAYRRRRKSARP